MQPFLTVRGVAAPLPQANVDTDVIMPKQFLKGITRDDLARGVFYDLRFDSTGQPREDFVLNLSAYQNPQTLIVGPNFGCGSSREHAVWGLQQFGVRCLIGSSFASIFQDNCHRNGLLTIVLPAADVRRLQTRCSDPARNKMYVDLVAQRLGADGEVDLPFDCEPRRRDDLLSGRDAIAATLQFAAAIRAFEDATWAESPWLRPVRP